MLFLETALQISVTTLLTFENLLEFIKNVREKKKVSFGIGLVNNE